MKILSYQEADFAERLAPLHRRTLPGEGLEKKVRDILKGVREKGEEALLDYTARFDGVTLLPEQLQVSPQELAAASMEVGSPLKQALRAAHRNVKSFALRSLRRDWKDKNEQGAVVGEIFRPIERVGIYVPGGSAPLISTAIMTVTLAKAVGCPQIVVCTPPGLDGRINPALLHAVKLAGATEVYRVGGAQAVAALAHGTASIAPVQKIFGPGNRFVVEAKRQVFGMVSIDLLPGPSEIMILSDASGDPKCLAADLLAQAEHGGDSEAVLVSSSKTLIKRVAKQIEKQSATLSRQAQLLKVLEKGLLLVHVKNLAAGVELVNAYAPEHLTLVAKEEAKVVKEIKTAGAIFLGNDSPVACGDFLAGPSHTLPTGGAGKSFPGLTVDMFQRRTSVVKLNRAAIKKSAPLIDVLATAEGLDAHARSARIRLES
ncbi:MAG: histidinol dehydrogenase [Verrucomicrobiota bacterium]